MSASGNSINYNIRTSKSVERRMILSVVKELFKSVAYSERRYIGFGSTYFTDFKLFHKELHFDKLISFELEESLKLRVEYNKPFRCIDIKIGKSTDLLPFINWQENFKDVIWLDYDDHLNYDIFNDVEMVFSNMKYGSVYLMTCNKQLKYSTIAEFDSEFGELVPNGTSTNDFKGENDFLLIRKMLMNKIEEVIRGRNYSLPEEEHLIFRQLFFFTYRDGAPMLSYGGYLDLKINAFTLQSFNLNDFEFISTGDVRYNIDPPTISLKESFLLNSHLPNTEEGFIDEEAILFIPISDRNKYRKLYKFLPSYMDVIQ